jgi:hypothetical protein
MSDKPMTPKLRTGDTFKDVTDETIYIIADIGRIFTTNSYALVSMIDGRFYANPVPNIENVFSGDEGDFVPVKIDVKSGLQSRKREVEWPLDEIYDCPQMKDAEWRLFEPHRKLTAEDGTVYWQVGKYIDEPVQKEEKELSRFLPDGWAWKQAAREGNWLTGPARYSFFTCKELWHGHGLLHPSEGGGFQKHTPGDPEQPCEDMDLLLSDWTIEHDYGPILDQYANDYDRTILCMAWRPHHKEQN